LFRSAETLDNGPAMKDWPPKPGSTVIMSTIWRSQHLFSVLA
jgi:hypothetical protein